MSEIWSHEIRTCLKSELMWVLISDISQKCLKSEPKSLDFRHILKKKLNLQFRFQTMSEIQTVWKPNSYLVSEVHNSSDFEWLEAVQGFYFSKFQAMFWNRTKCSRFWMVRFKYVFKCWGIKFAGLPVEILSLTCLMSGVKILDGYFWLL